MRTYYGKRNARAAWVLVEGPGQATASLPLDPSRSVRSIAMGFEWGYCGSGPAQLALALLLDFYEDYYGGIFRGRQFVRDTASAQAESLYHEFEVAVVARMPRQWTLTSRDIIFWAGAHVMGDDYARERIQEYFGHLWAGLPR